MHGHDPKTLISESDLGNFSLMNQVEKAYSVPYELMVCHDSNYIHGL